MASNDVGRRVRIVFARQGHLSQPNYNCRDAVGRVAIGGPASRAFGESRSRASATHPRSSNTAAGGGAAATNSVAGALPDAPPPPRVGSVGLTIALEKLSIGGGGGGGGSARVCYGAAGVDAVAVRDRASSCDAARKDRLSSNH